MAFHIVCISSFILYELIGVAFQNVRVRKVIRYMYVCTDGGATYWIACNSNGDIRWVDLDLLSLLLEM